MKTKHLFRILLSIIFATIFVACESEGKDGDWEPMKWESNTSIKNKNHIIEVPKSGNTYIFTCKNYTSFWVDALYENNEELPIKPEDNKTIKEEWYSIDIEKNIMTVIILPNNNDSNRYLSIGLTAGDIFDSFSFKQ